MVLYIKKQNSNGYNKIDYGTYRDLLTHFQRETLSIVAYILNRVEIKAKPLVP